MTQFEAVVEYAGKRVKVKSDSFEELHAALAGIEELNRDVAFLQQEKNIEEIVPVYRKDNDENEYFGLQDRHSRKNVTFGKKRGESMIPFFPKGAEGYYDPGVSGPRPRPSRSEPETSARGEEQASAAPPQREGHSERTAQQRAPTKRSSGPNRRSASRDDLPF